MRTQLETLDYLIGESDPEGPNRPNLVDIREKVVAGQAISGKDRVFIRTMLEALDNIECRWLKPTGNLLCLEGERPRKCTFAGEFDSCPKYERATAERRRFGGR
jgi:hypothetical protein